MSGGGVDTKFVICRQLHFFLLLAYTSDFWDCIFVKRCKPTIAPGKIYLQPNAWYLEDMML